MIGNINMIQTVNTVSNMPKKIEKRNIAGIGEDTLSIDKNHRKINDSCDIAALKKNADTATENLRSLVEKLILKQSKKSSETNAQTIREARQAISEDGEYGVDAVSERIVKFAIAISGGDKTKIDELKSSIDQGFAEAKKAFGGELPDICNRTYDEIMRKLDKWNEEA